MPFLIQGKSNWKYILIAVILIVIIGGVILNYTQIPKILKDWTCNKLEKLRLTELNKLDFNCDTDADCTKAPSVCSPICININANTEKYEEILDTIAKKGCRLVCEVLPFECKCLNNKCESHFKEAIKPEEITKEEIDKCIDIQDWNKRNRCFLNLAIKTEDPLICDYLPRGFSFERYSKTLCVNTLAILINTPSLCSGDEDCLSSVFMHNTDLCPDINVDVIGYVVEGCPGDIYCNLRYPLFKEKIECIEKIALERKDFELCKKIRSGDCQEKLAIELNRPEMCISESCLTKLAIKNKDIELCKNREECIVEVALYYDDPDLCGELSEKESQDECYYDFGLGIGEKGKCELCEKISNKIAKRYCMLKVAVTSKEDAFCKGLDINIEDLITKYTDEEFGFSFYYPKSFEISKQEKGIIFITKVGPSDDFITITKYTGQRVEDSDAKFGRVIYWYDKNKNQWMVDRDTDTPEPQGIHPIEPSFFTVSGLPIFPGVGRWATKIVALSTDKFLIVNISGSGWTAILDPLTKTIIKADQEVGDKELKKILIEEILSLEEIF